MVSFSSTKVEYIVATHASKEAVMVAMIMHRNWFEQQVFRLECDSRSEIFLEKNQTYHSKTKDIDVQYHFVREMVENGKVLLEKVDTIENVRDLLTKSVSIEKLTWFRSGMSLISL